MLNEAIVRRSGWRLFVCRLLLLSAEDGHFGFGLAGVGLGSLLRVPVRAGAPRIGDDFGDGFVRVAGSQRGSEVGAVASEKAGEEASVGGEACAGAVCAEWSGHGGDDSDDGAGWGLVMGSHFALVCGRNGGEVEWGENFEDALGADDFVEAPAVGVSDVHVFNEPDVEVWLVEAEGDGKDFVLVERLFDDGVDFHRLESHGGRHGDAFDDGCGIAI